MLKDTSTRIAPSYIMRQFDLLRDPDFLFAPGLLWLLLLLPSVVAGVLGLNQPFVEIGFVLLSFLVTCAVMCKTHRFIGLNERPTLAFGATEARYLLALLKILGPIIAVLIVMIAVARIVPSAEVITTPVMIIGLIALALFHTIPSLLRLPATALDRDLSVKEARGLMRQNIGAVLAAFFSNAFVTILLIAPFIGLRIYAASYAIANGENSFWIIGPVTAFLRDVVQTVLSAAILSFLYDDLVPDGPKIEDVF